METKANNNLSKAGSQYGVFSSLFIKNKLLDTYIQMKTLTLHTINYQPMLNRAWEGNCVFNSDRIRLEGIILG